MKKIMGCIIALVLTLTFGCESVCAFSDGTLFVSAAEELTCALEDVSEFSLDYTVEYDGSCAWCVVNDNVPYFEGESFDGASWEYYSSLDELGRCGVCYAFVGTETQPTESRGDISSVYPTGWVQATYDCVSGKYLYNRCHLIGYQLTGQNANPQNLITGTRYLNIEGMLPFEDEVDAYFDETGNHVLYRVTPIFEGDNLLADGVLMEAQSLEDSEIEFCVFCYNVQPGIVIDYATGQSYEADAGEDAGNDTVIDAGNDTNSSGEQATYILNTSTKKIHLPSCRYANSMSEANREEYYGDIETLLSAGYETCKVCFADESGAAVLTGDVNGDGSVDSIDAQLVLVAAGQYSLTADYGMTDDSFAAGDIDGDGALNSVDAHYILVYNGLSNLVENPTWEDAMKS